jgi:deoxyribose-phosphate aldolase
LTRAQLARMIEHTQLRAYATLQELRELCDEAARHGFGMVSVNPAWASFCAKHLTATSVGTDVCVGFPLGATTANIKVEEAREAVRSGASEIDMVINIGALKSGYPNFVEKEIAAVVQGVKGTPVKVILETSYLSQEEKVLVCQLAQRVGAAFVKTATGYGQAGATVEDVALMKQVVGDNLGIKAAGGIRSYLQAAALIQAGATRIGTSAGIQILDDMPL